MTDWIQALFLLQQWIGVGASDLIQLGKLLKVHANRARAENYLEKYRKGMNLISKERQEIVRFLYDYYRATSLSSTKAHTVRYSGLGHTFRDLPLLTSPELVFNHNKNLVMSTHFSDESINYPHLTEQELATEVAHWQAANISIWDEPLYTIHSIQNAAKIDFRLTRFLIYRATYGGIPDELAVAIATHGIKNVSKKRESLLPKRRRFLGSAESLLTFPTRLCAGGPIVLFAAQTDNDLALVLQRRSFQVSDEPGTLTVIPKAFHQPLVSAWDEVDISSTIYRECYEELFGGEDQPGGRRHISSQFYLSQCPAVAELYGNPNHILQPLGIVWDFLRGNYHAAYCLYVQDPTWWHKHHNTMRVNWEVDQKIQPTVKATQSAQINNLISRYDWAPEAYFTFIEGLRWLAGVDQRIAYMNASLPNLDITPLKPTSI